MTYSNEEIAAMVGDAEVDRRVYTDHAIFELEMDRIFGGTWVYAGHDSQVPNAGDYFTTEIGLRPVIILRDTKERVRVYHNRCPHRGAKLLLGTGNAKRFTCPFHAYSFNTEGTCVGVPLNELCEGTDHCRGGAGLAMREVRDVGLYRGFIFVRLREGGPDLESWLGQTRRTLDNFCDRAPEGEVEIVGPPLRWINECNWKFLIENIVDGAHVGGTHPSIAQAGDKLYRQALKEGRKPPPVFEMAKGFLQPIEFIRDMGVTSLDNGHMYIGGKGKASTHDGYSDIPGYLEALQAAYGTDRAADILSDQQQNVCIYPNLHPKTQVQKMRVFKPAAPNRTIVEVSAFRLKGAPEECTQRALAFAELLDSPATLVSTDDLEVMRRAQEGLEECEAYPAVSNHRGLNRPTTKREGQIKCEGSSELPYIIQYQTWKALMTNQQGEVSDVA